MLRDKDIREPLFDFLEEMCGKIRILEEKQIGKSRADIVMVLPELAHIQELNEMPKYKEKSKQFVIDKIAERIPEDTLSKQISNALFERDYNEIEHVMVISALRPTKVTFSSTAFSTIASGGTSFPRSITSKP